MIRPATRHSIVNGLLTIAMIVVAVTTMAAEQPTRYAMTGMVLAVDSSRSTVLVSHEAIPRVMPAMTMSFAVRKPAELERVAAGMTVRFTFVVGDESSFVEGIEVVRYQSAEQDPLTARRLTLLRTIQSAASALVPAGAAVPDFTLTNQARARLSLAQLRGKVVAVNFIYTSCALPQFCFRVANHFGAIQKQFGNRVGTDLVLLTITFDPARDTPERLADYATQWNARPGSWHFLTGSSAEVQRVCRLFGVEFFPDEGLINHSVHTAVIGRDGRLVANIEGNRYTAAQLADLIETTLDR